MRGNPRILRMAFTSCAFPSVGSGRVGGCRTDDLELERLHGGRFGTTDEPDLAHLGHDQCLACQKAPAEADDEHHAQQQRDERIDRSLQPPGCLDGPCGQCQTRTCYGDADTDGVQCCKHSTDTDQRVEQPQLLDPPTREGAILVRDDEVGATLARTQVLPDEGPEALSVVALAVEPRRAVDAVALLDHPRHPRVVLVAVREGRIGAAYSLIQLTRDREVRGDRELLTPQRVRVQQELAGDAGRLGGDRILVDVAAPEGIAQADNRSSYCMHDTAEHRRDFQCPRGLRNDVVVDYREDGRDDRCVLKPDVALHIGISPWRIHIDTDALNPLAELLQVIPGGVIDVADHDDLDRVWVVLVQQRTDRMGNAAFVGLGGNDHRDVRCEDRQLRKRRLDRIARRLVLRFSRRHDVIGRVLGRALGLAKDEPIAQHVVDDHRSGDAQRVGDQVVEAEPDEAVEQPLVERDRQQQAYGVEPSPGAPEVLTTLSSLFLGGGVLPAISPRDPVVEPEAQLDGDHSLNDVCHTGTPVQNVDAGEQRGVADQHHEDADAAEDQLALELREQPSGSPESRTLGRLVTTLVGSQNFPFLKNAPRMKTSGAICGWCK